LPPSVDAKRSPARSVGLADLQRLGPAIPLKPAFLTVVDEPWLRTLLDERARFVGHKARAFDERAGEGFGAASSHKQRAALRALARCEQPTAVPNGGPALRREVFQAGALGRSRCAALAAVASERGVSASEIDAQLFADLDSERLLGPLGAPLSPAELAARSNVELLSQILARALVVRIEAYGEVRAVVRHAKLLGLLCELVPGGTGPAAVLEISGPFALFQHGRLYARALSSLVPRLARCRTYRLEAECVLSGKQRLGRITVSAGDPVLPARELPRFDSALEARFEREFGSLTLEWEVVREPTALRASGQLIFPDFGLRNRATGQLYLLEIVGYWTRSYLERKLAALRAAQCDHLVLCIDVTKACDDLALPSAAVIVPFRRRLDVRAVLARIDPLAAERLARDGAAKVRRLPASRHGP
jgi:predicted nuclease of restriction endonuclease-like RecB superfamily